MEIKLIALDMDGTLLNDDGIVTQYTHDTIQKALHQGIEVVLSTGRPLSLCKGFAVELNLSSYIIASNGAEIWTVDGELIERHIMEPGKVQSLWELGEKRDLHMWLVSADNVFSKRPEVFTNQEWLKLGYGGLTESEKMELRSVLEKDDTLEVTNSSMTNLEVNQKGINKANAIRSICGRLGIKMDQVMAAGDSLNDLKMIEQAGLGIAVKNAQQLILESADYVTASNNEDGVAKAIEKYALK